MTPEGSPAESITSDDLRVFLTDTQPIEFTFIWWQYNKQIIAVRKGCLAPEQQSLVHSDSLLKTLTTIPGN